MQSNSFKWLGATTDDGTAAAWGLALQNMRDGVSSSWAGAKAAYLQLKKTREGFGLPFIDDSAPFGGEGQPVTSQSPWETSAWSSGLDQSMANLQVMVKVLEDAATEAVAGKRHLMWNENEGNFAIEGKPEDEVRIALSSSGIPYMIDPKTNKKVQASPGTVGTPALLWVAAGVAVVQSVAVYFIVETTCETIRTVAEQKTMRTIAERNADLVQSGKATPAEVSAMTKSVYSGAASLATAKAVAKKESTPNKLADTVTTVAYVGLGLGALYVLAQFITSRGSGAVPARAYLGNPARKPKVRTGYGFETKGHWEKSTDEAWDIVVLSTGKNPRRYKYTGTRFIDGSKVNVWNDPQRQRYVAQQAF